jgi:hypothetical protein
VGQFREVCRFETGNLGRTVVGRGLYQEGRVNAGDGGSTYKNRSECMFSQQLLYSLTESMSVRIKYLLQPLSPEIGSQHF